MADIHLSMTQKMMLLKQRYKCTEDLWLYLTERGKSYIKIIYKLVLCIAGFLLPTLQGTRMQFLE